MVNSSHLLGCVLPQPLVHCPATHWGDELRNRRPWHCTACIQTQLTHLCSTSIVLVPNLNHSTIWPVWVRINSVPATPSTTSHCSCYLLSLSLFLSFSFLLSLFSIFKSIHNFLHLPGPANVPVAGALKFKIAFFLNSQTGTVKIGTLYLRCVYEVCTACLHNV